MEESEKLLEIESTKQEMHLTITCSKMYGNHSSIAYRNKAKNIKHLCYLSTTLWLRMPVNEGDRSEETFNFPH